MSWFLESCTHLERQCELILHLHQRGRENKSAYKLVIKTYQLCIIKSAFCFPSSD